MAAPAGKTPAENTRSENASGSRRLILGFFIMAVTLAGCMFTYKLFAFLKTIRKDELAGFAFDPIVIYALVAIGFLCLLGWAFMTGQFHDIERAKYEMIERFDEQERAEFGTRTDASRGGEV